PDAAAHPDLAILSAGKIKATVGPLDRNHLPGFEKFRQFACVVAKCLDVKTQRAEVVPAGGYGEGVRAFMVVEGDEGKLTGLVAFPAITQLHYHCQHTVVAVIFE